MYIRAVKYIETIVSEKVWSNVVCIVSKVKVQFKFVKIGANWREVGGTFSTARP